jgi:hypothetical protein
MNSIECLENSNFSISVAVFSFLLGYFFFFILNSNTLKNRPNIKSNSKNLGLDDVELIDICKDYLQRTENIEEF